MRRRWKVAVSAVLAVAAVAPVPAAAEETELGQGGWSWFGDPRAVTHSGQHTRTYVGWIDREGNVIVASWDHATRERASQELRSRLQRDDHANPSLFVRPDGRLTAFYSAHNGGSLFYRTSTNPEDVTSWGPEQTLPTNVAGTPSRGYTYPNPLRLAAESRTYLFWRGANYQPTFSVQDDGEAAWSAAKNLLAVAGQRPYVKYHSDGGETIHFAFTNAHPREAADVNIYYARYSGGVIERADGEEIGSLAAPIARADADTIFDGAAKAWVHDVAADGAGRPVVVFASFPGLGDHRYNYARWTGTEWDVHEFAAAGGSISADGREEHYSGGLTLDHEDPSRVYLSRQVGNAWEVEIWTTGDGGATWSSQPVTSGSQVKNVRPISPRGLVPFDSDLSVVWMRGAYPSYVAYETSLAALLARPPTPQPPATPVGTGGQGSSVARPSRLRFTGKLVRVDYRGRARIEARCLAAPGDRCRLAGVLELKLPAGAAAPRTLRIGRFSGTVPGGRLGSVRARLTRSGLRRLTRARRLRARAVGTVRNAAGEPLAGRWTVRLALRARRR